MTQKNNDQAWKDLQARRITFEEYAKVCETASGGKINPNSGVQTITIKNKQKQDLRGAQAADKKGEE
jgi:hypothetical protein